ncbi:MAG: iron-containing alcohol dehydrogenase [Lentisphaeria bacterium]|nr:iron-containing alcohol dehydrogenase [Lentisphaeria bacterium]
MIFDTHKPVKIITGDNCIKENSAIFAALGKRAMIISGKTSADKCGAMADVAEVLEKEGITYVRFAGIPENPPAPLCHEIGAQARSEGCDFVIAIGGGSAIDAAKAIAAYAANPQCDVMDIFDNAVRTIDGLPLIAIPTTAGTGSEACRYSVLTIADGAKKRTFSHPSAYAKYSFVCPRYSSTMNEKYTVSTALDALAHAIESYFSPKSCSASEEAALYAAKEIWDVLFREEPEVYTADHRARLAYAAAAAGIAIDYTGTGFPHPLGYSITLTRGIPHGSACAVFEGEFLRYNMLTEEGRKRASAIAEAIGTTADEMIERIPQKSGIELKLDAAEREELIDRVAGAGNYANSPYVISRNEMSEIYAKLFG